ncbi:acyl-CoA dehydrogenase family protein [Pseudoramibacter alactolyticus]|uniref:acyl-CoA dehydrogenase family protein n=1 Tax=Pseudoramibacter alactolyticus TaxID=113287 RepID=UPI0028E6B167|nr:acyl-CoA dehydrogenase family protein [Pseudoramibacter alactolyticus]
MQDFILTDEQKDLVAVAKDFAERELAPVVEECDAKGEFPMDVYKKFVEQGFSTMFIPEAYGGIGAGALDLVLVNEQFAKVDAGFIVSATTAEFGVTPLRIAGTEEQIKYYFERVMDGQLGAFCLTEADAGSDASATRTTAVRDGDDYILNGSKCFISSGGIADMFTVFAVTDKEKGAHGISCFLVEKEREGVGIGKEENKMGLRLSNTTSLSFDDVRVPAKNLIGEEGQGFMIAMQSLDRSRGVNSYGCLGIAERAIDEATKYAMVRRTFGKPIIKNQGISFMLADMEIQTTAARTLLYHCADMIDKTGQYDTRLGSVTKTFVSDVAMKVTADAVQILGGYGYSKEYPVEKLMRDAKIFQIFEGTNQIQRMVIGREMQRRYKV